MSLSYLDPGKDFEAADMAALFTELDRKLGLLLDGKSPLILMRAGLIPGQPLFGKPFYFLGPSPKYADPENTTYDHGFFTAAAGAAFEQERNDDLRWMKVLVSDNFLDIFGRSLEAMKRTDAGTTYYLWESGSSVPEKHYNLAVAELIFDDWGPYFSFPLEWDKYNFFRIHNLSPRPLQFMFGGGGPTQVSVGTFGVEIPAYGCVAVRRESRSQGYRADLRYFWQHQPGDPRFLAQEITQGAGKSVYATMTANNVANPALLFQWIQLFEAHGAQGGMDGVKWYRDPHAIYDLYGSAAWTGDKGYIKVFGDPTEPGTIIGDLVHNFGKIRYFRSGDESNPSIDIDYKGYASLRERFTNAGLHVEDTGANLVISAPNGGDINALMPYGTNLLGSVSGSGFSSNFFPITSTGLPIAIDARWPSDYLLPLIESVTDTVAAGYTNEEGEGVYVYRDQAYLREVFLDFGQARPMQIWRDTVPDVLTLRNFGRVDLEGTNQETSVCAFENRRVVLTIFGPQIHFEQRLTLNGRLESQRILEDFLQNPLTEYVQTGGGNLVAKIKRVIEWPPVGWGTPELPAFFTPRIPRRYSIRKHLEDVDGETWAHPNIKNDEVGRDGADFETTPIGASYLSSKISALAPGAFANDWADLRFDGGIRRPNNFPVWFNPDFLFETLSSGQAFEPSTRPLRFMPRIYMLDEIFNSMVAAVNSLKKARPVWWKQSHLFIPGNALPLTGTNVVPIDQYAKIDGPIAGVPDTIADKSDFDFPADTLGWEINYRFVNSLAREEFVDDGAGNTSWALTYNLEVLFDGFSNTVIDTSPVSPYRVLGVDLTFLIPEEEHRYITLSQARQLAEAQGWKFIYQSTARSLGRQIETPGSIGSGRGAFFQNYLTQYWVDHGAAPTTFDPSLARIETPFQIVVPVPNFVVFSSEVGEQRWKTFNNLGVIKSDAAAGDQVVLRLDKNLEDLNWLGAGYDTISYTFNLDGPFGRPSGPLARTLLDVSDVVERNYVGHTIAEAVWAPKKLLVQNYCSAGIAIESKALLIPESYFAHTTTDYSLQSPENFQRTQFGGSSVLPLAGSALPADSSVGVAIHNGDNQVEAIHGADSVYVTENNIVDLT